MGFQESPSRLHVILVVWSNFFFFFCKRKSLLSVYKTRHLDAGLFRFVGTKTARIASSNTVLSPF